MTVWLLPLLGFITGLLIISLGGGGGAVYVGALTAVFNIPPAIAASTSLATVIPTTAVGALSHWKAGNVNMRIGAVMLCGGLAGTVAGSLFSGTLPDALYDKITGGILVLLALQMSVSYLRHPRNSGAVPSHSHVKALAFGLLGGVMVGLVGLSGGGPIVAGLLILDCSPLEAVGTSVFVIFGMSIVGFLAHLSLGKIDWPLVGLLTAGTASGAFAGPLLLSHADRQKTERMLRPVIITVTFFMGMAVLGK